MNIRSEKRSRQIAVEPQAIVHRPVEYVSHSIDETFDDLDEFKGVYLSIGNQNYYELRNYTQHPDDTMSIYIEAEITDLLEISEKIHNLISQLGIPDTAIGWVRGNDFKYGVLERNPADRLREKEASILVLKVLFDEEDGLETKSIRQKIRNLYYPSSIDKLPLIKGGKLWDQVIRNVVSNRNRRKSIFSKGYARYDKNKIYITKSGVDYVKSLGFA